jgi:hypothetical protein
MSIRRKRLLAAIVIVALVLLILSALRSPPQPPISTSVTISFLGFTNFPSNNWPYARFAISNQAPYAVRLHGFRSEVQGNQNGLAPVVDTRMPECHFVPDLNARSTTTYAIGQPSDEPASAPRRFDLALSQYTMSERWFDLVWRHDWLQRFGALRMINTRRILDPTNHTTISSPWLKR